MYSQLSRRNNNLFEEEKNWMLRVQTKPISAYANESSLSSSVQTRFCNVPL